MVSSTNPLRNLKPTDLSLSRFMAVSKCCLFMKSFNRQLSIQSSRRLELATSSGSSCYQLISILRVEEPLEVRYALLSPHVDEETLEVRYALLPVGVLYTHGQGLTLVHLSAQRKHFSLDKGYLRVV
jgi:hypothetical protein